MSRRTRTITVILLALLGLSSMAMAESLLHSGPAGRAYLIRDSKARSVGDLVTVVITEQTDVTNRDNRQLGHQTAEGGGLSMAAQTDGGFGAQGATGQLNLGANSDRTFDGLDSFRSDRRFLDQMTVVVIEVLPNGNLVVSGRRDMQVSGERRTLCLSGVIRPIDLGPDNTIQSSYVTDLKLEYLGDGPGTRHARPGWFSRFLGRRGPL